MIYNKLMKEHSEVPPDAVLVMPLGLRNSAGEVVITRNNGKHFISLTDDKSGTWTSNQISKTLFDALDSEFQMSSRNKKALDILKQFIDVAPNETVSLDFETPTEAMALWVERHLKSEFAYLKGMHLLKMAKLLVEAG